LKGPAGPTRECEPEAASEVLGDKFFDNRIRVQIWRRPPRGGAGQMRR